MAKRSVRRESRQQVKDEARRQETSDDRSSVATMEGPDPEAIARRAYEIYCERGYRDGRAMDDWLEAESELKGRRSDSGFAG